MGGAGKRRCFRVVLSNSEMKFVSIESLNLPKGDKRTLGKSMEGGGGVAR